MQRTALKRALMALATGTTHLVALLDADGSVPYVGPSVTPLLGYDPDDLVGRKVTGLLHPDDLTSAMSVLAADVARPADGSGSGLDSDIAGEYRLRHADGSWVPFEFVRNNLLRNPDVAGILVLGRPLASRQSLDEALGSLAYQPDGGDALQKLIDYLHGRLRETSSAVLIAATNPPEWVAEPDMQAILGGRGPWEPAMATGEPAIVSLDELGTVEPRLASAARSLGFMACWCLPLPIRKPRVYTRPWSAVAPDDGTTVGCLVVWSKRDAEPPPAYLGTLERAGWLADIAIRRRAESQRLRHLVDYDQVTGALSRVGIQTMMGRGDSMPRVTLLIDLDDFKNINDSHGHSIGDDVLRLAVKRIGSVIRYQDLLGRWGGDEFLLLVAGSDMRHGSAVAQRIIEAVETPITVGSVSVKVHVSIGIAPYEADVRPSELVDRADRAMYAAKRGGKRRWVVWGAGS